MASRAAARSGDNSSRVELTKTRRRWSGVRIVGRVVGTSLDRLSASSGKSVAIGNHVLSGNRLLASLTWTPENWEGCFNLPVCSLLFPFSTQYSARYKLCHALPSGSVLAPI